MLRKGHWSRRRCFDTNERTTRPTAVLAIVLVAVVVAAAAAAVVLLSGRHKKGKLADPKLRGAVTSRPYRLCKTPSTQSSAPNKSSSGVCARSRISLKEEKYQKCVSPSISSRTRPSQGVALLQVLVNNRGPGTGPVPVDCVAPSQHLTLSRTTCSRLALGRE